MSHLWQRFLLVLALVLGLALGVAATVFGYSNTSPVNVRWAVLHFEGIPLWTVAVVPLVVVLALGTLYHWLNNVHHFTENVRHRRRVHELEEEVKTLRAHLDHVLDMPDQGTTGKATTAASSTPEPAIDAPSPAAIAVVDPSSANGDDKTARKSRKRAAAAVVADTQTVASSTDGDAEVEPRQETEASTED